MTEDEFSWHYNDRRGVLFKYTPIDFKEAFPEHYDTPWEKTWDYLPPEAKAMTPEQLRMALNMLGIKGSFDG